METRGGEAASKDNPTRRLTTKSKVATIPKTSPAEVKSMEATRPTAIKKHARPSAVGSQNATIKFRLMGTGQNTGTQGRQDAKTAQETNWLKDSTAADQETGTTQNS
jgi:hypothetical protein